MSIEEKIFSKTKVDFDLLLKYGFKKEKDNYIYSKQIDNFNVQITVNNEGIVIGKLFDIDTNEEYTNIRLDNNGAYSSLIKEKYINILNDIKEKCFKIEYFFSKQANEITDYINKKYNDKPEFLWEKFSGYGVFRNKVNKKWYAIIMNITEDKLGLNSSKKIEIINVMNSDNIVDNKKIFEGYHMNKKSWITIKLDNSIDTNDIYKLIDNSYKICKNK
ncbi:MAG: MmcQ/YjbR family DNA-binding protein [Bacilli bacterium]|nr:MmcQ/YjbR family DNA-binding protein [Bacilli bacterium]